MIAAELTPQEMRKDIRRLIKKLSRRISNIEAMGDTVPQIAVDEYRELEKRIPHRLTELSDKDLRTLYRDLRYINALKTSTVKGALKYQKTFQPIKEKLEAFSKPTQDKFWDIYRKFYEHTGGISEAFKYEIFDASIDFVYAGVDVDEAVNDLIRTFNRTLMDLGSDATDEEVKVLFTSKLDKLLK